MSVVRPARTQIKMYKSREGAPRKSFNIGFNTGSLPLTVLSKCPQSVCDISIVTDTFSLEEVSRVKVATEKQNIGDLNITQSRLMRSNVKCVNTQGKEYKWLHLTDLNQSDAEVHRLAVSIIVCMQLNTTYYGSCQPRGVSRHKDEVQ